ncbi:MAG: glycosyltransferase [Verrucomicrobia bacterium]|nr:glycosyltransferase [Verrucomicrobiota bacterium]
MLKQTPAQSSALAASYGSPLWRKLEQSIQGATRWVEENQYRAYDPGDGCNSFLHGLTFNRLLLERLLQQAVYRAPMNLRPLLGIRPHTSTKGMGYMAWGYLRMFRATGSDHYRERAEYCLEWLIQNRSTASREFCWGNHFSFSTRAGKIPKGEPTIVWSSLIGQAFLEASETLNAPRYLDVARSVCAWIVSLPREETGSGTCLSYVGFKQSSIHNSNMLGAAMLACTGAKTGDKAALEIAQQAMVYSCKRQRPDGAWFYGEEPKYLWIDNFHTGYNLDSLRRYMEATGDRSFESHMLRGFAFFKKHFFEADGCPRYYHNQKYPVDIQCAAQAIDTLTLFSDLDPDALPLAQKVASWTIDQMQDADGHFFYRDLGWTKIQTPMLHWGQATMIKALSHLLYRLSAGARTSVADAQRTDFFPARLLQYVLVTPARNEEAYIENTIRSVLSQTRPPKKWIIVSDGSTDRTEEIVQKYAAQCDWIELLRMPEHRDRQFAAKAHCFNAGYDRLKGGAFDIIGNLDADISFGSDYFEFLLGKFSALPQLGVAGTPYLEDASQPQGHTYGHRFAQLEHVSGACQLFRRDCFEAVGGYNPIKGGGIDWIAVTTARLNGWQTRTFLERTCVHHRKLGTGTDSPWIVRFRYGQKAYAMGGHPLFEGLRGLFQTQQRPFVLGGILFLAGYFWAALKRMERPVSNELMQFHRAEQMGRLRQLLWGSAKRA